MHVHVVKEESSLLVHVHPALMATWHADISTLPALPLSSSCRAAVCAMHYGMDWVADQVHTLQFVQLSQIY